VYLFEASTITIGLDASREGIKHGRVRQRHDQGTMTKEKVTTIWSENGAHEAVIVARVGQLMYSVTLHIDGRRRAKKSGLLKLKSILAYFADDPSPKKATYVYFRAGGFHADIGFYPFKSHTWLRYYNNKGSLTAGDRPSAESVGDSEEPLAQAG
jgi:hypothetical protein